MVNVRIVSSGIYLPKLLTTEELYKNINVDKDYIEKHVGVKRRYHVTDETASHMGSNAIMAAVNDSPYSIDDIDCIISASGGIEQPIPCNGALIKKRLGLENNNIPTFDINSTCLSFVTGFDIGARLIETGLYNRIIVVTSEISSVGLNWEQKESCYLFGDGAVAFIIEKSIDKASHIIKSHMETYCEAVHDTEIRGGGSALPSYKYDESKMKDYLFDMDGRGVFTTTTKYIGEFVDRAFEDTEYTIHNVDKVIPHQASALALKAIRKKLDIKEEKFVNIVKDYGNMVAASIPLALHLCINDGSIVRGDIVALIGTSAGLSFGSVLFKY